MHVQVKNMTVWRAYDAKLFEYVAKNAGLRAARCKYVLVTNPDIAAISPWQVEVPRCAARYSEMVGWWLKG